MRILLDRFLLSADMLDFEYFYRQWVGSGGDFDHHPVYLQILNRGVQLKSPFKFNPHWLEHDDLVKILTNTWVVFLIIFMILRPHILILTLKE